MTKREETDLDDVESFCDSVYDVIAYHYNLKKPVERIKFLKMEEI